MANKMPATAFNATPNVTNIWRRETFLAVGWGFWTISGSWVSSDINSFLNYSFGMIRCLLRRAGILDSDGRPARQRRQSLPAATSLGRAYNASNRGGRGLVCQR